MQDAISAPSLQQDKYKQLEELLQKARLFTDFLRAAVDEQMKKDEASAEGEEPAQSKPGGKRKAAQTRKGAKRSKTSDSKEKQPSEKVPYVGH